MRRKIAIDIDDTLAATTGALRLWSNRCANLSLTEEDFQEAGEYWGYYERVWQNHEADHLLKYDDFHQLVALDEIEIPLLPGAEFAIHELAKRNSIVMITSRSPDLEVITRRWIERHFGEYKIELYFAKNHRNGEDATKMTKGQLCRELNATLLIDDSLEHCMSACEEGIEAILFGEYGWQKPRPAGLTTCRDWQAALEYING